MKQLLCTRALSNTGLSSCYFDPGNIEGAVLIPKGKVFTQTEMLTFQATLAAAIANNNIANRIFPIKRFVDMEDKSEDNPEQTFGYGGKTKIRQGKYAWYFMYRNGGMSYHKSLYAFDGMQEAYDVMFIDAKNNILWGVVGGTNNTGLGGFDLELIDVKNFKVNTGGAATMYGIGFCLEDPNQMNIHSGFYQFPKTVNLLQTLTGLKNIEVTIHTPNNTGLIKLLLTTSDGAINLGDVFPTELATASLYSFVASATQAALSITSVVYDPITGTFNVLLDVTDADYIAMSPGDFMDATIGDVSDLVTALVLGYANTEFSTTK